MNKVHYLAPGNIPAFFIIEKMEIYINLHLFLRRLIIAPTLFLKFYQSGLGLRGAELGLLGLAELLDEKLDGLGLSP